MTDCLDVPSDLYPAAPSKPDALTDKYVVELTSWGNRVLGIATNDRIRWRGERRCIQRLQKAGQVR